MVISRRSNIYHHEWCPYVKKMNDKYKRTYTLNQARSRGYHECKWCGGEHGLYLDLRDRPECYKEKYIKNISVSYDSKLNGICFRTVNGFWKILWDKKKEGYKLWHLNQSEFDKEVSDKVLMNREFHRQADVEPTKRIGRILQYIYDHDKAKRIMGEEKDWRKLPTRTQLQRDYKNKLKKKERKKSIRRVNEIFKQLEAERKVK